MPFREKKAHHIPEIIIIYPGAKLVGSNPCIACGACCALFRATFYWAESDLATPAGVPQELTDRVGNHLLMMKGTSDPVPRCIALEGSIGIQVRCAIYDRRSSTCRNFMPSREDGITVNERCDQARHKWGLPPLVVSCWSINKSREELPAAPESGSIPERTIMSDTIQASWMAAGK